MIPPVVVGALFLATGLFLRAASFDPAVVLTTALVLIVIAGSVFPWLALGATGTKVDQLFSVADITADADEVHAADVAADARVAHEILVAVSGTVGLLLVLIAPLAVGLGLFGTLVALMCCLVVMLRTRQYRVGSEVLVGLVAGIAGLATVAVSVLWLHPELAPRDRGHPGGHRCGAARGDAPALDPVRPPWPTRRRRRDRGAGVAATPDDPRDRRVRRDPELIGGDQEGPRRGLLVQQAAAGHGVRVRRPGRPGGRARRDRVARSWAAWRSPSS